MFNFLYSQNTAEKRRKEIMEQKRLVMLILCFAMLLALPLTVKADSSKAHAGGVMPPFDEELLDLEEMRAGIAELGFKDGIFWATLIHDGLDTEEISAEDLLESESGLCLYPILNTGGRTDMPMTMAFVSYSIYTEPLESGGVDEYQPMFWAQSPPDGEDYTPASATTVSRVDHHGKPIRNYNVVVIMAIILGICKLVGLFLFLRHKQIKK